MGGDKVGVLADNDVMDLGAPTLKNQQMKDLKELPTADPTNSNEVDHDPSTFTGHDVPKEAPRKEVASEKH
ncbi:unnamed protein product [Linum trigynum]|uniref:Uncharacterized protein n=1 Tax=Linum trigynum TaxID=586398 RepID=A0AAV2D6Y6_9ROSI